MSKYKIITIDGVNRYKLSDTGVVVSLNENDPAYQELQSWLDGNTPDDEYTSEELNEINKKESLKSIDETFETTLMQPVDCTASGTVYVMDGCENAARRMRDGIEFCDLIGQTTMNVVGFYNNVYPNVLIDDCREIMKQQAVYYVTAYMTRAIARAALL